jgi:hypothetical protein
MAGGCVPNANKLDLSMEVGKIFKFDWCVIVIMLEKLLVLSSSVDVLGFIVNMSLYRNIVTIFNNTAIG